jgi:Ca-activated chloride channel family protein
VEGAGELDLSSWAVVRIPDPGTAAQIPPDAGRIKAQSTTEELMKRHAVQKCCLLLLLLLIVLPFVAVSRTRPSLVRPEFIIGTSQNQDTFELKQDGPYVIRTNVDLVVLRATVRDGKGAPVSGLKKESFQVYEDKVLQQIQSFSHDDIPVTVGLVIDSSGSMRPKHSDVIGASLAFVHSSNPEDQVFVVNFNEHVSLGLPANLPFTSNTAQLEAALSRNVISGMTALYDAIATGLEQLQKGKWDKKVLIVVSDGGDNASKRNLAQVMSLVYQSNAVIYTMGIFDETDEDRNPRVLKQLSRASGGEAFFPKTLQGILPICEQIAHDIRSQYTITFVPTNRKQNGAYRAIDVKAREATGGRRLSVITRAGYSAPLNLQSSGGDQVKRP